MRWLLLSFFFFIYIYTNYTSIFSLPLSCIYFLLYRAETDGIHYITTFVWAVCGIADSIIMFSTMSFIDYTWITLFLSFFLFFSNTFLIYILPQPSFVSLWENYLILWNYRAAADALSKRHSDGSLPLENFNIELEDQSGQKVRLGSENDQRYDFRNTVFSLSVWILLVGFY